MMIKEIIKNYKLSIIKHKSLKGFTLIELLIVIAIIGVLASLLMANFVGVRQRARDAQRKSDLRQIQSALEIYRADNSSYPTLLKNCTCSAKPCLGAGGTPPACSTTYMQKIPGDPLGGDYTYTSPITGIPGSYSIKACLENASDSQKDTTNVAPCNGTTNWSYTVVNP